MRTGTAKSYRVFVRNWWRYAGAGEAGTPGVRLGLQTTRSVVPDPGARKTTLGRRLTEEEARTMAQEWNRTHKPGPLSRKAEWEDER